MTTLEEDTVFLTSVLDVFYRAVTVGKDEEKTVRYAIENYLNIRDSPAPSELELQCKPKMGKSNAQKHMCKLKSSTGHFNTFYLFHNSEKLKELCKSIIIQRKENRNKLVIPSLLNELLFITYFKNMKLKHINVHDELYKQQITVYDEKGQKMLKSDPNIAYETRELEQLTVFVDTLELREAEILMKMLDQIRSVLNNLAKTIGFQHCDMKCDQILYNVHGKSENLKYTAFLNDFDKSKCVIRHKDNCYVVAVFDYHLGRYTFQAATLAYYVKHEVGKQLQTLSGNYKTETFQKRNRWNGKLLKTDIEYDFAALLTSVLLLVNSEEDVYKNVKNKMMEKYSEVMSNDYFEIDYDAVESKRNAEIERQSKEEKKANGAVKRSKLASYKKVEACITIKDEDGMYENETSYEKRCKEDFGIQIP